MSIFGLLAPISRLLKVKDVDIYDNVFRLHSKLTVMLFLAFSALVSAHEFFGKPMDCVGSDMRQVDPYFNNYCWINGTYTLIFAKSGKGKNLQRNIFRWCSVVLEKEKEAQQLVEIKWHMGCQDRLDKNADTTCIINGLTLFCLGRRYSFTFRRMCGRTGNTDV